MSNRKLAVVVLAAGKGTRMKSSLPKVLHKVLGRTVLNWVIEATKPLAAAEVVVVVGHEADQVKNTLEDGIKTALQENQRGSGDALAAALPALEGFSGDVLVVNGDGALFTTETMQAVVLAHQTASSKASALAICGSIDLPYGRIIRGENNQIDRIVEAKDATANELSINELNAGIYCFDYEMMTKALPQLSDDNSSGELYITDLLKITKDSGERTLSVVAGSEDELLGINTRLDLAEVEQVLRKKIVDQLMLDGVTISMPHTVLVEPTAQVEPNSILLPGSIIRGSSIVKTEAVIGPNTELVDTYVAEKAVVERSVLREATVGASSLVGPFAFLRPNSELHENSKVGAYVEIKNSVVGEGSKVPHLSYIGDAEIGTDTNIGAGNITANYRPEMDPKKQKTIIGSNVRTGSDCVFVAPVTVADNAWTGAGSIITKDVPEGALAMARARQTNIDEWVEATLGAKS